MSCNLQLHVISSSGECYIYIIVTDMEGNIRIYRLPKGLGTDQWKWYCPSWISNLSGQQPYFLRTSRGAFLANLVTLHTVVLEKVENVSANQRPGQQSWINNCFKKIQHFFRTLRDTIVVSLVVWHAYVVVLKKLKMWNVYNIWMDGHQTLFEQKSLSAPLAELR